MAVDNDYKGYRGEALTTLQKFSALIWSDIEVLTADGTYKGRVLPRSETADDKHIVIKLVSGYNIGIAHQEYSILKLPEEKKPTIKFPKKNSLTIPVNQE